MIYRCPKDECGCDRNFNFIRSVAIKLFQRTANKKQTLPVTKITFYCLFPPKSFIPVSIRTPKLYLLILLIRKVVLIFLLK